MFMSKMTAVVVALGLSLNSFGADKTPAGQAIDSAFTAAEAQQKKDQATNDRLKAFQDDKHDELFGMLDGIVATLVTTTSPNGGELGKEKVKQLRIAMNKLGIEKLAELEELLKSIANNNDELQQVTHNAAEALNKLEGRRQQANDLIAKASQNEFKMPWVAKNADGKWGVFQESPIALGPVKGLIKSLRDAQTAESSCANEQAIGAMIDVVDMDLANQRTALGVVENLKTVADTNLKDAQDAANRAFDLAEKKAKFAETWVEPTDAKLEETGLVKLVSDKLSSVLELTMTDNNGKFASDETEVTTNGVKTTIGAMNKSLVHSVVRDLIITQGKGAKEAAAIVKDVNGAQGEASDMKDLIKVLPETSALVDGLEKEGFKVKTTNLKVTDFGKLVDELKSATQSYIAATRKAAAEAKTAALKTATDAHTAAIANYDLKRQENDTLKTTLTAQRSGYVSCRAERNAIDQQVTSFKLGDLSQKTHVEAATTAADAATKAYNELATKIRAVAPAAK